MLTRPGFLFWCAMVAALVGYMLLLKWNDEFNINSNILHLLPETRSDPAINQAFETFSERNMRLLVFLVENSQQEIARQGAQQLSENLSASAWVANVMATTVEQQRAIAQFNFDYRYQLATSSDVNQLASGDFESFSLDTIERIYSPIGGSLAQLLIQDPFLLSYRFNTATISDALPNMVMNDGFLTGFSGDKFYVLLSVRLTENPFDPGMHEDLLGRINDTEQGWLQASNGNRLLRSGALFYTADAYATARQEVSLFGGASLILVLSLVLCVFRQLRPILLVALALGFGISLGFAAVRLLYTEVHLLTFIFGASLVGVAVDYAFHFFTTDAKNGGDERLKRIFPAISLGLLSSAIGYSALVLTPFPGLQQMAVFCITGLAGAYATVVLVFPIVPLNSVASERLTEYSGRILKAGGNKRTGRAWMLALVLPVVAIWLVFNNDEQVEDVRTFQSRNPQLEQQESQIQEILDGAAANQFYLVRGDSPESLLLNLEAASTQLDDAVEVGTIRGFQSVSPWLTSRQQQKTNYGLYRQLFDSGALQLLVDNGLLTEQELATAKSSFESSEANYLDPAHWLDSPLGRQLSYLWLGEINGQYFSVIALHGIQDLQALEDIGDDVLFVDQVSTISNLLGEYRQHAGRLLMIAAGLIFVVLSFRLGPRKAGFVLSSPVIAISLSVVGLFLLQGNVNLFNVLALFLVLGIGIDFGIFFAESGKKYPGTLLAIALSALTTLFSFGMLSLSSTTVIQSFGLTMLMGIATVFLLAPVVAHFVARDMRQ